MGMIDDFDGNFVAVNETLREKNVYPEKFIQEPDDEENHHVKPFKANSTSEESCTPVKEEIVSKISQQKKQHLNISDLDNIKLVYQSHQTTDGEPDVQEMNVSQIFDDKSKKLHKQTDRELEGTMSSLLNSSQVAQIEKE